MLIKSYSRVIVIVYTNQSIGLGLGDSTNKSQSFKVLLATRFLSWY